MNIIKLGEVAAFLVLQNGIISIPDKDRRTIRLEVNCSEPTQFKLESIETEKFMFLANVEGHAIIEFVVAGECLVHADTTGDVYYWSPEFEQIDMEVENALSLTKMANRAARNPELELMLYKKEQNQKRRMKQMQDQIDLLAALAGEKPARVTKVKDKPAKEKEAEDETVDTGETTETDGADAE